MTTTVWDAGVVGPPGPPGPKPLIRRTTDFLQYSYEGAEVWLDLIALSELIGPKGDTVIGPPGPQGLQGIQGPQGIQGIQGLQGTTVKFWVAIGAPSNAVGLDGDMYINSTTGDLFGPKVTGIWPITPSANLRGPSGINQLIAVSQNDTSLAGSIGASGGWRTRAINTLDYNNIAGASFAANRITVPAGTYEVNGFACMHYAIPLATTAPGLYLSFGTRLYNITAAATALNGLALVNMLEQTDTTASFKYHNETSLLEGTVTFAAQATLELQSHWSVNASLTGVLATPGYNLVSANDLPYKINSLTLRKLL